MRDRADPEVSGHRDGEDGGEDHRGLGDACPIRSRRGGNTSPIRASASRKMPLAIRVKLWKTTSRETWMSIAQRRLRTAARAISGAARMVAGARAFQQGEGHAVEQHAVGVEQQVVQEDPAQADAEQVDVPARLRRGVEIEVFQQQHVADGEPKPHGGAKRWQRGRRDPDSHSSSGVPPSTSRASRPIVLNAVLTCSLATAERR